jgi:agmatinase
MANFNPNDIGVANGSYFGLPYSVDESEIVILPIPWDVTTSYKSGTSNGPKAILDASLQVDLFDVNVPFAWKVKIATLPVRDDIIDQNVVGREISSSVIKCLEMGYSQQELSKDISKVNIKCSLLNEYVRESARMQIEKGKIVGVLGGEHSVPYGFIQALSEKYDNFGILHIDAHADLREAYEGFLYSHASIMFNVLKGIPQVSKICQVGQRDFCHQECSLIEHDNRISFFSDMEISNFLFEGGKWSTICDRIIDSLPDNIYISFDIDGLSPDLCPNTGTPVPGGLSFRQADYLLFRLANSGKKIIGFDLCEVTPGEDEWDANVGARLLYKICLYIHHNMEN